MALFTITRRILGSILTPFRTLNNSTGPVRTFKEFSGIKCNAFVRIRRQPVIRFRKGNCRQMSESCHTRSDPVEKIYFHTRPVPIMMSQCIYRLDRRFMAPIARYSGFPGLEKKKFYPMETQWRSYALSKDPGPDLTKGGTISGVGIRKIDTTNERGYFPRTSKSRVEKIKQMLKDKSMLKGTDDAGKEPK